ncbi:MAG: hypothetical protein NTW29_18020 [Bacteroidetes bacterium]|nr:hypothetical protein [Bacteroidota bacterium]
MAKSEYKKNYEEELNKASQEREQKEQRVKDADVISQQDLEGLSYVEDDASIQKLIALVNDTNADTSTRASALQNISSYIADSEDLRIWTIRILGDQSSPTELRLAALSVLKQASFSVSKFNPQRAAFLETLRQIFLEESGELKMQAAETLATNQDGFIREKLMESLTNESTSSIAPEKAIQLLSYDVHGDFYPLLRAIVKTPPNAESKIEAIRVLAADAESKSLILETLQNTGEDKEVRNESIKAFQSMAPDEFNGLAKEMVLNESEDDELRSVCLAALSQQAKAGMVATDEKFEKKVAALQTGNASNELKKSSNEYLENITIMQEKLKGQ